MNKELFQTKVKINRTDFQDLTTTTGSCWVLFKFVKFFKFFKLTLQGSPLSRAHMSVFLVNSQHSQTFQSLFLRLDFVSFVWLLWPLVLLLIYACNSYEMQASVHTFFKAPSSSPYCPPSSLGFDTSFSSASNASFLICHFLFSCIFQ